MAILRKDDGFITLIETSNAGTYTIENENDTIAEVVVVGAGGGGVGCAHGSKWYYADGGGGAAFVGTINLPAGTYTVTVGAGGASNFNASSASDAGSVTGGNSSLGDLIIAGGGIRGSGTNCVYPGAGGTLTVNADVISSTIQSNGNNATGGGMNGHGQAQSLYQDYGKGGMGIYGGSVAGTNGYVKVRIKVAGSKTKAYNIMQREKAYWKTWQQPVLTSNGTMGGDSFAVSSNVVQYGASDCAVYMAFDDKTNTQFHSTSGVLTGYIDWYNPKPLKITNIKITNQQSYDSRASTAGKIYGSNNGTDWTLLTSYTYNTSLGQIWNIDLSSNTQAFLYYRLESTKCGSDYWTIGEIDITAKVYDEHYTYKAYNIVDPSWESVSQTFNYTGALQTYTVPNGVTSVQVDCVGATGAKPTGKYFGNKYAAGKGGRVKTEMSVTPGETFFIWVGKEPSDIKVAEYNASDIRTSNADITSEEGLNSRLVVAGAGGSGAENNWSGWEAGDGGGLIGGSTVDSYGLATGGTQTEGGTCTNYGGYGSQAGGNGTFGMGGAGSQYASAVGGAGGAGWYGGAGGNAFLASNITGVSDSRGGAGGSSYTDPTLCSNVSHVQGFNDGNGYVKITYKRRRF